MFITKENVLKKLELAKAKKIPEIQKRIAELKKELKTNSEWHHSTEKKLKQNENRLIGFKSVDGIPYRPRSGEFSTGNSGFDPATGRAHSYHWYDLGRVINGVYVVNSFGYSMQTWGHYHSLCATLKMLGIKYLEIEAPRGLQSLESGRDLYLSRIAEYRIAKKYGSKKCDKYRNLGIKEATKQLGTLEKLGVSHDEKMLASFIQNAEAERLAKIARQSKLRDQYTLNAYAKALREVNLRGICKFHALNKRRVARGLPELKP